jgi:hypothetical protein
VCGAAAEAAERERADFLREPGSANWESLGGGGLLGWIDGVIDASPFSLRRAPALPSACFEERRASAMRCGEPTATRRANGRAVLAAGMLAVAVVAFVAAVRDDGATVLMGDDIAKDALHDMGMLSRAKEKAIAGGIKSAKAEKGYFTSAFDAAFNKGWRDAGYKARRAARKEHVVTHLGGHSITGVTESRFVNSMVGAQDLVARVQSLAETKLAEGLCAKQDVIVEKLTQLLDRLKRESGIINITDTEAYQKMMLENSVYLEVESVYQMSQEKHVDEKGEEQYATDQFEVQKRIEDLTKTDLKTLIEEYPGKKEKIDGERGVVLELIDMVEKIDENNLGDVGRRQSLRSALQRTSSALSEVSHGAKWGEFPLLCLHASVILPSTPCGLRIMQGPSCDPPTCLLPCSSAPLSGLRSRSCVLCA